MKQREGCGGILHARTQTGGGFPVCSEVEVGIANSDYFGNQDSGGKSSTADRRPVLLFRLKDPRIPKASEGKSSV